MSLNRHLEKENGFDVLLIIAIFIDENPFAYK